MLSRARTVHAQRLPRIAACLLGAFLIASAVTSPALGQAVTNDFVYQAQLKSGGVPLNGTVDLRFSLWDAAAAGNQIGVPVAVNGVAISNGLVTATLNFGPGAFSGNQRWVQIEVDGTPGGGVGPFVTLSPRQPLRAAPYALFALAGSGQWTLNGTALNYTTGNISVGTTSQLGKLTVFPAAGGGGTQTGLYVRNTDDVNQYSVSNFISDSPAGIAIQASVAAAGGSTGRAISATNTSATGWAGYFTGRGHFSDSVGIGTTSPLGLLHVSRPSGETADAFRVSTNSGSPLFAVSNMSLTGSSINITNSLVAAAALNLNNTVTGNVNMVNGGGSVGINTTSPAALLHVSGTSDAEPGAGGVIVVGLTNTGIIAIDGNEIMARNNGAVSTLFLNNDGGDVVVSGGTGKLITPVLQITGGADLSEQFEVNANDDFQPEPGMVVVIDPDNPGELVASTSAYDKKVAGVISGAGGVATGMMMGHTGTLADGAHAVALTGRVYCMVDATSAAIEPGDMLTTSDTPGHAMKAVDESRSHGSIIGKAMTALPQGERGLVLVLVNLQ